MALKLEMRCWTHISGTSEQVNVHFEPNMRNHPAVWAVPSQRKLFVLHGEAERSKAYLHKQKHGDKVDYHYTELWSFDVDEEKWEREKLRGNAVSSRAEMAAFYSPELGRTLVYGGYHGGMFTMDPQSEKDTATAIRPTPWGFQFAYLGDTFLFDPTTGIWQHVLVKGFPSYRLGARFVVNPEDGKVYLFGGSCNSNFVPSKTAVMRTYNDLWQLKIDMPGGHWDPKDLERDTRMERIGPWTRCYACGSCGIDLQKCGGTCGGKVYFCSRDCQKESWKEHKTKHGCRKV
ncbi:hypothetical protein EXIGLDRAFT_606252 [Exidia glandulosa HHB12029]|uniref:MYND-type domain-containing protein n=1 Tax=Exidia glandulosa HHB12029 TaxID=1314781 RepID=A0A165MCU2_EXIGL|nr:hypothetical protein EXIGLDRAFT_606252 [Exidia glandulosa HHB12029]